MTEFEEVLETILEEYARRDKEGDFDTWEETDAFVKEKAEVLLAYANIKQEPVSEELEEAANKYGKEQYGRKISLLPDRCRGCYAPIVTAFKAGAKWQKKQYKETIEVAEDHAMLAGMEKMKEEMMKDAVGGYVIKDIEEGNGDFLLSADYLPKSMGLKDQQRVKVIVIKED